MCIQSIEQTFHAVPSAVNPLAEHRQRIALNEQGEWRDAVVRPPPPRHSMRKAFSPAIVRRPGLIDHHAEGIAVDIGHVAGHDKEPRRSAPVQQSLKTTQRTTVGALVFNNLQSEKFIRRGVDTAGTDDNLVADGPQQSGGTYDERLTAVVAAVIKLADFLLPGVEGGVLHPAMYILIEGAMIAIICQAFSFRPRFKSNPTVALWESRLAVPAFAVAVALTLIVG